MVQTRKQDPNATSAPALFPEGPYDAIVTNASEGPSKSSGMKMLTLDLSVVNPETDEEKKLKYFVTYYKKDNPEEQTWGMVNFIECLLVDADTKPCPSCGGAEEKKGACRACHGTGDWDMPPAELIGRRVIAHVKWEDDDYQGRKRKRERAKYLERHPEGPLVPAGEAAPAASANSDADDDSSLPF